MLPIVTNGVNEKNLLKKIICKTQKCDRKYTEIFYQTYKNGIMYPINQGGDWIEESSFNPRFI